MYLKFTISQFQFILNRACSCYAQNLTNDEDKQYSLVSVSGLALVI